MRLLYCAGSTIPSDSANSIHVMRMCEALSQLGHDVTLLAKQGKPGDAFKRYGVSGSFELITIPFESRRSLWRYLSAAKKLGRVDALVGRYIYPVWLLRGRAEQFAYESHQPPTGLRAVLEKRLLQDQRCVGVPVISKALLNRYTAQFGDLAAAQCFVLPDAAVDPGEVIPPQTDGKLVVGYAGSDYQGRGLDIIVSCARALPDCEFAIAGTTAARLAQQFGNLPDNLHCAGRLEHADVPEFLRASDVLLAPYQRTVAVSGNAGNTIDWCSPLKLFEYLAQGKAIVCSDLPALREILNEDNAVLVEPDDSLAWINAIQTLNDQRSVAQRIGAQAREDFSTNYTWTIRASRLVERFA